MLLLINIEINELTIWSSVLRVEKNVKITLKMYLAHGQNRKLCKRFCRSGTPQKAGSLDHGRGWLFSTIIADKVQA